MIIIRLTLRSILTQRYYAVYDLYMDVTLFYEGDCIRICKKYLFQHLFIIFDFSPGVSTLKNIRKEGGGGGVFFRYKRVDLLSNYLLYQKPYFPSTSKRVFILSPFSTTILPKYGYELYPFLSKDYIKS